MPVNPTPEADADPSPRWTGSVIAVLVSMTCSTTALLAVTTALGKQVFDLTHSELALGMLGLAEFAPSALLILLTGTLADRLDRRRLTALGLVGQAGAIGLLAWYATTSPTSSTPIFLVVLVFGVGRAFTAPAQRALPADTVSPERLPWLTVRRSATWQISTIIGPVIGGFFYAVDVSLPFVFGAVFVGIGAATVLLVRPWSPTSTDDSRSIDEVVADAIEETVIEGHPVAVGIQSDRQGGPGLLHEAMEGLRFVRREQVLLGAISLDLFAVLFGGAVALLPAIAEERLGVGAVGLGWLRAATGIGAATVTLSLAARPLTRRIGATLLIAVATFGVGTIALGLTTSFVVAFVALALLSGADAISVFIRAALVPLITPSVMRGRVLAVEAVFVGGSNELGAFESGVTGQLFGAGPAVVVGGVCTLAVALLWWKRFPQLRQVDRFPTGPAVLEAEATGAPAP